MGYLGHSLTNLLLPIALKKAKKIEASSFHINHKIAFKMNVAKLHKAGLKVYAYTVDDFKDVLKMKESGVDGIVIGDLPIEEAELKNIYKADWGAIKNLKDHLRQFHTPVLGNGDIWTGFDALNMMAQTGADGVVVGRGCLGRPWLFSQLTAAFAGEELPTEPRLDRVLQVLRRHAELLCLDYGEGPGCQFFLEFSLQQGTEVGDR